MEIITEILIFAFVVLIIVSTTFAKRKIIKAIKKYIDKKNIRRGYKTK